MGIYTYPHFPEPVIVGIAPGLMKTLHPLDLQALCQAFKMLTGVDPLMVGAAPLHKTWAHMENTLAKAGRLELRAGT